MAFYYVEFLVPRPTLKMADHPLSVSTTVYSIHSQLPSIPAGHLQPQPEDAPCRDGMDQSYINTRPISNGCGIVGISVLTITEVVALAAMT
jgi:hypothetical protein